MTDRNEFLKYAVKDRGMSSQTVRDYISHAYGPENLTRTVIEERQMPFREVDVFSRLMADRIIFLGTGIDDYIANVIQAQLLFLESTDASKDIQIYINSPGGSVCGPRHLRHHAVHPSGCRHHLHRHGCVHGSRTPLRRCCWQANGLEAQPGLIHQPLGGASGQASDIEITAREIQKLKKELYAIISHHSGQTEKKVWNDSDRDYWMIASEAKEYGMIDEVLERK